MRKHGECYIADAILTTITSSRHGLLITLEGIESSGKSTHLSHIAAFLQQRGLKTLTTREPGGTPLAENIRTLLLHQHDHTAEPLTPEAEVLLFYAARAQHLRHLIQPNLAKGITVISDRFVDSSYAYQQAGRAIAKSRLDELTQWIIGDQLPDITFIFDLPVAQAMQRMQHKTLDRIEREHLDFHDNVRQAYLQRAAAHPERCILIDASPSPDQVKRDLMQHLCQRLYRLLPAKISASHTDP